MSSSAIQLYDRRLSSLSGANQNKTTAPKAKEQTAKIHAPCYPLFNPEQQTPACHQTVEFKSSFSKSEVFVTIAVPSLFSNRNRRFSSASLGAIAIA